MRIIKGIKKRNIVRIVVALILIVTLSYASEEFIPGRLQVQKITLVAIAGLGMIGWLHQISYDIKCKYWTVLMLFCLPFILSTIWTIILTCVNGDQLGTMTQAITTTLFLVVDFLATIAMIQIFDRKVDKIISFILIGVYVYIILLNIQELGINNAMKQLFTIGFERNDIGIAIVPLILYYLYVWVIEKSRSKYNIMTMAFLLSILIFCGKRSAILSLTVGTALIFIQRCRDVNTVLLMKLLSYLTFFFSLAYVACIHIGTLNQVFAGKGTLTDRLYVWKYFDNMYTISPLYIGKGFGYIHRYMIAGLGDWMVNNYRYLHNSILQIYIENGFIGFIIWTGIYIIAVPNVAKKKYGNNAYIFTVINMIAMFAMFTVDNGLTYPLYQISLYISLYSLYRLRELKYRKAE